MKFRSKAVSILLAFMMVGTTLFVGPMPAYADDGDGPKDNEFVKYYYDSEKPMVRTGYKTIILDPCTYKDVTNNSKKKIDVAFLENVVEKELLPRWAPTADWIFATQGERASYDGDSKYASRFRSNEVSNLWFNVKNELSKPSRQKSGTWGSDGGGWATTGVSTASCLQDVRSQMGNHIIEGMNTHNDATPSKILNDSPLGKRLQLMNVEQKKDTDGNPIPEQVFYNIGTSVERSGTSDLRTCYYRSFGVAFYDFSVNPIVDENVEYVFPGSDEAEPEGEDDASGLESSSEEGNSIYAENNSTKENNVSLSYTNTQSTEISSSIEKSQEITFGQSVGIGINLGGGGQNPIGFPRVSLQFEFTFSEAYRSAYTEGKTTKKETSQAINTETTLPPQTAIEMSQVSENKEVEITYNTPVAITYKVAIFSLGGHNYADGVDFYQGSRDHSEYCTLFGQQAGDGGSIGFENLYNRAVKNVNIAHYDKTYGKTYGRFRNPGGRDHSTSEVDWHDATSTEAQQIKSAVDGIMNNVPLCPCGTTMTIFGRGFKSAVQQVVPMYPLDRVRTARGVPDEYEMCVGDKFALDGIDLEGFNMNSVPYYGFDESGGHWVCCDESGNEQATSQLVSLTPYNSPTGRNMLTANREGTQYLKWVLNPETNYTSKGAKKIKDGEFRTQLIKIRINDKPFDGSVSLEGDYTGYVGDPSELLPANGLKAAVRDSTDKEISRPVFWEAQEINGITIDEAGNVQFTAPGKYHVRVYILGSQGKVYSPGWTEIEALPARVLDKLTLSDEGAPKKVLEPFVLGDGSDQVDLSKLTFKAEDQYGESRLVPPEELKWVVNGKEISGNLLDVKEAGIYSIQLRSGKVTSNPLQLEVKEKRKLVELTIQSTLTDNGLGIGSGYEYDLGEVDIKAKDQYGRDVDLTGKDLQWISDNKYSIIENDKLTGNIKGTGTLKLKVDGIESNQLTFRVYAKPYVKSFTGSWKGTILDGDKISLDDLIVQGKDQSGNRYTMMSKEVKTIKWTLTDRGTITAGIDYDDDDRTIKFDDDCLGEELTGTAVLEGTFMNENGIEATGWVELKVQQQPILKSLTLGLADEDGVIREGEKVACMEFFTVTGKDQYGDNFDLSAKDLEFTASDTEAFEVINDADKERSTIKALAAGGTSKILVKAENRRNEEILSNEISLTIPKPRELTEIRFANAPELAKLDVNLDARSFVPVCYDENGEIFSAKDLVIYNRKIEFSIDSMETDASIDRDGIIRTGSVFGPIKVMAMAVDADSNNKLQNIDGDHVTAEAEVFIGPKVESVTLSKKKLDAEGGTTQVNFSGKGLISGIEVIVRDKDGNKVTSAKTDGNYSKQTANVKLGRNTDGTAKVYDVIYKVKDVTVVPEKKVNITVDFHKLVRVKKKAATCTAKGHKEHYVCSKCGKIFQDDTAKKVLTPKQITLPATGHKWDTGKVAKVADRNTDGTLRYTCRHNKAHVRTEKIPVLLMKADAGTTSQRFIWTRVKQATGYDIYFTRCDDRDTEKSCRWVKSLKGNNSRSFLIKNLGKNKAYKGYVVAYKMVNGNKMILAKSYLVHSACGDLSENRTNANKVTLRKKAVTLKAGKQTVIKGAKILNVKKKKKLMGHEAMFRYATSNRAVATVNSKGVIKGVKKGTCVVYVIAENGVRAGIKVTVK